MEVDVVINGQLAKNAVLTDELHKDNTVDRRTLLKNKNYHVFFCYRDVPNDKLWVKEAVKKLENDYGYICCDHERDFLPGTKIMDNIKYGIKNSEKVVSVLSSEGLDSEYLRLETEMAHREGLDKRENLLIPVLLDNCEIPDELKLLTYIDARKEINERIWWPKLIAAIESKAGCSFSKGRKEEETKYKSEDQSSFYFKKLCALRTTFSCFQCSIQSTSKYIPRELVSNDEAVPVETIKNLKRDLLDVPRVRCKQKCCCFVNGCLVFCLLLLVLVFIFDIMAIIGCAITNMVSKEYCFGNVGIFLIFEISVGICCGVGWKCYYKEPKSLDKKIIEYNTELIKNGKLITLVSQNLWKSASEYVLFHLKEERKMEREIFVNISGIEEQHDAEDVPLMTGSRNQDLAQATEDSDEMERLVVTSELQAEHDSDDVPLLNISGNDEPSETNKTLHWRHDMKLETEPFVGTSFLQEKHFADDDVPLLAVSENEQLDQPTENVAMTLLLKYAHEYLRLAVNGKMNNPMEDRHKADCMCLCQYIEKTDKKFRKLVDRNKSINAKSSSIEHITENKERDALRL